MLTLEDYKLPLYWTGVVVFLLLELRFSYRLSTVSKTRRWLANIPLSIFNGALYHLIYFGAISGVLAGAATNKLGLLNAYPIPQWVKILLGIAMLDFVIYVWHLLNHTVPFLWRFHRVHHSDMNMDVSTANRFHAGEILLSGLVRLTVIYAFGISTLSYILFEIIVNIAIQFHHSSIKVSTDFEKIWILLFVPPSMHRIHHSVKRAERDSNYGVIFSLWDRMMGTLVSKVDQKDIVIGIGSHRKVDKLGFFQLMGMPFTRKSL